MKQVFKRRNLNAVVFFALLSGLLLSACNSDNQDDFTMPTLAVLPSAEPSAAVVVEEVEQVESRRPATEIPATLQVTEEPGPALATQEVDESGLVTQEVVPPATQAAETPEVFTPREDVRYQTDDGDLFVVVTTVHTQETMPMLPDAPEGQKFVELRGTLANLTGNPITVDRNSLALIDQQFNRYAPVIPEEGARTYLAGAELNGTGTFRGSVRFSIPDDAVPYLLEWCPLNECDDEVLQTRLP